MSEWQTVNIAEVCSDIIDCVNRTAPTVDYPTPYKMIRTTNVKNGWIDTDNVRYVSEETYVRWARRGELQRGDVILTREAPLGEVGIIRHDDTIFMGQRLMMYRADPKQLDAFFLLYAMQEQYLQGQIRAYGSGSTVEHMRVPDAKKLNIFLPPLPTQRRIAAILSAYDDLIENNTRRIKALEQAAHDLYREWFVEFRFPGHESVPLVDSGTEYGMIPQGWGVVPVSDAIEINPRIAVNKDEEKPFIEMARLSESSMYIDTKEIPFRTGNSGSKFQNYDTLFARITPCLENGKTGYVTFLANGDIALGSTEFVVMRSRTLTPEYVYCLSRLPDFRASAEKTMTGASGRQRVQNSFFDNYLIVQPLQVTLEQFQEMVSPMFDEITVLAQKNDVLREARDLLLPRLVSGELSVEDIPHP